MTETGEEREGSETEGAELEPIALLWDRLSYASDRLPVELVKQAIARRDEIIPLAIATLEKVDANPARFADNPGYFGHFYALLLLAQFRVTEAFPLALRFLTRKDGYGRDLLGDLVTESGPGILASLYAGDLQSLKDLFEDDEQDVFVRIMGMGTMATLVEHGMLDRDVLGDYILDRLERAPQDEHDVIWSEIVRVIAALRYEEHKDAAFMVLDRDLVDPAFLSRDEVAEAFEEDGLPGFVKHHLIDDVIEEMSWWYRFDPIHDDDDLFEGNPLIDHEDDWLAADPGHRDDEPEAPFVRLEARPGRNEPCLCGSGKKYKKCCGA